jgi:nucleotide-binding universal stress UspA family protein
MSALPTKILLASDGSEDAAAAARAATDVSRNAGSELHVVHAWETPNVPAYPRYPLPDESTLPGTSGGPRICWPRRSSG